jgi:hypothetical protein
MKKLAALTLLLFLTTGMALADTPKDSDPQPAKAASPAKAKAAKKAEKSDSAIAAEIEELRQALQSQQEQLQLLKEELAKRDRQIDEAREAAAAANARAAEASTKAVEAVNSSAEVKTTAATLSTTVSDLKSSNEALKTTVAKEQAEAKKAEETGPANIKFKGITLTPGGFLDADGVFRNRATSADINTPFTGIPYPGNSLAKVSELNFTGRHSRISLLAEGTIGNAKATGYYEIDWLGACTTSNNRQSNSYCLRQRQIWGQVAGGGWAFTGGQMWTLATENRKGIQNRGEIQPMVPDPQYEVGYTWARQPSFRITKDFGGKFAFGISVEAPQITFGGRGFSTFTPATGTASQNFFVNAPGAGGGLYNAFDATGYTPNKAPDLVVKAAFDPGYGHYEVFGILSTFRNRVYPCAVVSSPDPGVVVNANGSTTTFTGNAITCAAAPTASAPTAAGAFNDTRTGGGGGASARVLLFGKKVELAVQGMAGDGVGRYGSAQLADATARPDGTLSLIRTAHGLGAIELHPTPKLDVYFYGGSEYAWRAGYTGYQSVRITTTTITDPSGTPGVPVLTNTTVARSTSGIGGYGNIAANNTGCSAETVPTGNSTPGTGGTCAGDIRVITEGTAGFWYKFYNGPKGGVRWGIQYSYFTKSGWSGSGGLPAGSAGISPKAVDNMVLTSFRYYLP